MAAEQFCIILCNITDIVNLEDVQLIFILLKSFPTAITNVLFYAYIRCVTENAMSEVSGEALDLSPELTGLCFNRSCSPYKTIGSIASLLSTRYKVR
jgi:hypothetical protein